MMFDSERKKAYSYIDDVLIYSFSGKKSSHSEHAGTESSLVACGGGGGR